MSNERIELFGDYTARYFFNEKRRKAMDYRTGSVRPDDELRGLLGLS